MKRIKKKQILLYMFSATGIMAALFYFSHVIVGRLIWTDYNPYSQPISDLTAVGTVSEAITSKVLYGYNIFNLLFCGFLIYFFKRHINLNKLFYTGIILMFIAEVFSTFGYMLFPLDNTEWANTFQNTMHYAITGIIVFSYILLSILLTVGMRKTKNYRNINFFLIIFTIVFIGSGLGTVIAAQLIPAYAGFVERINLYSLMVLKTAISIWIIYIVNKHKKTEVIIDD